MCAGPALLPAPLASFTTSCLSSFLELSFHLVELQMLSLLLDSRLSTVVCLTHRPTAEMCDISVLWELATDAPSMDYVPMLFCEKLSPDRQ